MITYELNEDKEVEELRSYAFDKNNHNYASKIFKSKFSEIIIFKAIKYKNIIMKINKCYKNRYKHLTIYDEEIDFLINMIEKI